MPQSSPNSLNLSRRVLGALIRLNLVAGVLILALLVASLIAESWVFRALGVPPAAGSASLFTGMRLIMAIGIAAVPVVHLVLTRLLAIVQTVGTGDPFVAVNAERLRLIAWATLALELMHVTVGTIAAMVSSADVPLNMSRGFSITRWLAVLLLFVLARVFEQGARMREDLAGTV